ncbi:hypothetical protein LTR37_000084 [Vermiconidia calcicola]|uniref:Uncharacterized protein n=1 Tax=Vermiconidia calcicola TaxID=1690605 RepID=A0ACC3NZH7_9PEZI|nr:hypothetical protein LTR37_000084 [Vermiconidia calcicola]
MSSSWTGYGPSAPVQATSSPDNRLKKPAARQLLSCTKCRERKVKCDRTKPCSACCARGHPKECEFVVGEGNDYSPIPQSYEIRKLRAENQRLRERLQAAQLSHSGDEDDGDGGSDRNSRGASRASAARQRRFKTGNQTDNLYFGSPGLATILSELSNFHLGGTHSLSHPMPKGRDMYASEPMSYPFQVVVKFSTTSSLLQLLPERRELFECLELFQRRAQSCSFPNTPDEVTRKGVEQFLSDGERNAELYPDMLALIFATLATGLQMGQYDRSGGQWLEGAVDQTRKRSDVYSELRR